MDGDGEENQCGCKQCNGRVMCSPGQTTLTKSCQGNAAWRRDSGAVFTTPFHCHVQSTCTSQLLKSVSSKSMLSFFFLMPFWNAHSARLPIKALDCTVNKNVKGQDQIHIFKGWCSLWWLMVSILVNSFPLKTDTSTHTSGEQGSCKLDLVSFELSWVDQGSLVLTLIPRSLFSYWTNKSVHQLSINTARSRCDANTIHFQ